MSSTCLGRARATGAGKSRSRFLPLGPFVRRSRGRDALFRAYQDCRGCKTAASPKSWQASSTTCAGSMGSVDVWRCSSTINPCAMDASVEEGVVQAQHDRELLKDDEFVVLSGRLQLDHFSGGLRVKVQQLWSLADARCRFGRYVQVPLGGPATAPLTLESVAHACCKTFRHACLTANRVSCAWACALVWHCAVWARRAALSPRCN